MSGMTRQAKQDLLDDILKRVMSQEPDSSLVKALMFEKIITLPDVMSMSHDQIVKLQYKDGTASAVTL